MSRGFIIGAGGEGLSVNSAVLHVTAPAGSTVSIAKGGVTVKSLGPEKAHIKVDGVKADYYFSIAPANYGEWTVTAVLGADTADETAAVIENRQYDVALDYRVPSLYQAITYLETTSAAWFDTGIIPTDTSYETRTRIQAAGANGGYLFGVEGGYYMRKPNGYEQLYYGYNNSEDRIEVPGIASAGTRFDIIYNAASGAILINGAQKAANANIRALASRQYSILVSACRYGAAIQNYGAWRYEDFVISNKVSGALLCDLRPCYRKADSVVGFWDDVSKTFLTSQGTGTVIAGPDLS